MAEHFKPQTIVEGSSTVEINSGFKKEVGEYQRKKDTVLQEAITQASTLEELAGNLRECLISPDIHDAPTIEAIEQNADLVEAINSMVNEGTDRREIEEKISEVSEKLDLQGIVQEMVYNVLDRQGPMVRAQSSIRRSSPTGATRIGPAPSRSRSPDSPTRITQNPLLG